MAKSIALYKQAIEMDDFDFSDIEESFYEDGDLNAIIANTIEVCHYQMRLIFDLTELITEKKFW